MPRILVLRRAAFGDTLVLLPLLRALQRRWPDASLELAGQADFAAVLHARGAVAAAPSSEDFALWALAGSGATAERARGRLCAYERIVADQELPAGAGWPPVARLRPEALLPGVPAGQQFVQQVAAVWPLVVDWPRDAWFGLVRQPEPASGPLWLCPGSGARAKCWPRAHWLLLAAELSARGVPLGVVVGPAEQERDDPRRWPWPGVLQSALSFAVDLSPVALADRLAGARGCVGNDSGPTHLAAMLGVPTVAVFGASDPSVWAPQGPRVQVCGGPGRSLAEVAPAEVCAALAALGLG
jgi:ADP-heptose:LPS heptosyltransferase